VFLKMRSVPGTTAFGSNEVRAPPGGAGMEDDESDTGHEEVYVVLAGSGTFKNGDELAVEAADYARSEPTATGQPLAGTDGMGFIAVGGRPQPTDDGRPSLSPG
jgi:hypothetical protein